MRIKYVGNYIDHVKKDVKYSNCCHFDIDEVKSNQSIFKLLNDKDRDILFLIFVSKKKQKAVQRIMKRSQPSLVYDIKRIRERIQFIVYLKKVYDIFMDFLQHKSSHYSPLTINVLILMFYTTSYTHTGKVLGCPQIFARNTFEKALKQMCELKHWDVYEIFSAIKSNKNRIRRIYKNKHF